VGRIYPLVAEGIAGGLYLPNRSSSVCSRRYCAFAEACEREFGGTVAALLRLSHVVPSILTFRYVFVRKTALTRHRKAPAAGLP
jgi:hypothetical protein